MELRDLMAALRFLARKPKAETNRLSAAEMRINEYIWPLSGSARQSAIASLRDAIRAEVDANDDGEFWDTVEEYVATLT